MPKIPLINWVLLFFTLSVGIILLFVSRDIIENHENISFLLNLVGSFLVIAVPLELLRIFFFEEANLNSFADQVSKVFDAKIDTLFNAKEIGLGAIVESLPIENMLKDLNQDETFWWLDTYYPYPKRLRKCLDDAIKNGVSIKMLIHCPDPAFCDMRANEINYVTLQNEFKNELVKFHQYFLAYQEEIEKERPDQFEIIPYNDLIGVPCYIVTDKDKTTGKEKPIYAYSSMYLTDATGTDFPHFRWTRGRMCDILFDYVKQKYERNKAPTQSCPLTNCEVAKCPKSGVI